ncbi:rab effector MyRIP isoform X2 [Sardina pilchardus]|uniref:rab effector MyRIP isoform X2 n=1 Tax=Sardina pilchardus TaxID=27697 RepID=UPI002E12F078
MSEAGEMGRKLDLSGLSEAEAQHVLQVVQRDMKLREKEEARLSEMKQELDAEGSRCSLLSRQHRFNERCCIRCCAPFTFLLNPKRPCLDCQYNVCKGCCTYSRRDKAWLCAACQKSRLLKTQSLEWYYNNVRRRFKRFGSAKVLKTLYRKHAAEQGNLAELTEGSTYAESTGNEGSVCDSDSAFYKQIEEHNMADTITVALRVAEEAIDEAITKAETHRDSQEKQREAQYLRENREELIEELATTIVHKIIRRRRDLSDMQPDYNLDWPPDEDGELLTAVPEAHSSLITSTSLKSSLWRSRSAFSLLTDGTSDPYQPVQNQEDVPAQPPLHGLKKEGLPILPTWKSVDRLDNSMLQSPDGNWIALQSTLLSRPSLLAKRKSLVFSVLEKESGVVSAYDEMGSDTEAEPEGAFGALLEFRRKMKAQGGDIGIGEGDGEDDGDVDVDGTTDDGVGVGSADPDTADSDLEGAPVKLGLDGARLRYHKPLLSLLKKKKASERRRTPPRRPSVIDMNFNPEAADSSEADETQAESATPTRTRRRRRSRREHLDDSSQLEPHSPSVPVRPPSAPYTECSTMALDDLVRMRNMMMQETPVLLTPEDGLTSDTATPDILSSGNITPEPFLYDPKDVTYKRQNTFKGISGGGGCGGGGGGCTIEQDLTSRLEALASKVTHFSSTEDELDRDDGKAINDDDDDNDEAGGRQSRESLARDALWDMEVEDQANAAAEEEEEEEEEEKDVNGERLAEMDIDMEEVREEGEKYILSVRAKVLELDTRRRASLAGGAPPVEQTWWESLSGMPGEGRERRMPDAYALSEADFDSLSEGLDEGGSIDDILSDMVRSSEIEIEKSAEAWDQAGDRIEAMDVREDRADEVRPADELDRSKVEVATGKDEGCGGPSAGKGGVTYDKDNNRLLPWEWLKGDNSKLGAKIRKSYKEKEAFDTLERKRKEHLHRGAQQVNAQQVNAQQVNAQQVNAQPSVEQRDPPGKGQVQEQVRDGEVSEGRKPEEDFTFRAVKVHLDELEPCKKGSREEEEEEVGEKMEVKESEQPRAEESVRQPSPARKPAEEEQREGLKMATVSGKVAVDGRGAARGFREESSSSPDPNPYPSPDDINKDRYGLELEHNLQLISNVMQQKYSAASLRSVTTEMLRVLNATEDLIQGAEGSIDEPANSDRRTSSASISPGQSRKLDEQLSKLEENVYVAASTAYGLEGELSDLEACARRIGQSTNERELAHLEDQVASAAAQVQQSELQVTDIAARIAALKTAGLNVAPQHRLFKPLKTTKTQTIDTSRQQRRRLPAPPTKEKETTDI